MARTWNETQDGDARYLTAVTDTTHDIGNADDSVVGSWMIQVDINGASACNITIKGRATGSALAPLESLPYQYQQAATVTAIDKAAGTVISASGIYYVRSDGLDVSLVMGTMTGGPVLIWVTPRVG